MRYSFKKLGDRHKQMEKSFSQTCMKGQPFVARLDGNKFSKWTKGLKYPYDERLQRIREECMKYIIQRTNAKIGYSQSDEFTFIFNEDNPEAELYFGGRTQKLSSILSSMLTAKFNQLVAIHIPDKIDNLAVFDCRVYQVPSKKDAVESLVWREMDCTKNSISMLARAHFSHSQVQDKNRNDMLDMLHEIGVNWNDSPHWFKRGTYVKKKSVEKKVSTDPDLMKIVTKYNTNVPEFVIRNVLEVVELKPLTSFETDELIDVVFSK